PAFFIAPSTAMGQYSINELERLSGIKAHTIRIWEKRYSIINPTRTRTNIRLYSDEDLKKIINVSLLNSNGVKISRIAGMSAGEISQGILDLSDANPAVDIYIDQLVVAMVDMEEEQFEKVQATLVKKLGLERSITEVIYPF